MVVVVSGPVVKEVHARGDRTCRRQHVYVIRVVLESVLGEAELVHGSELRGLAEEEVGGEVRQAMVMSRRTSSFQTPSALAENLNAMER